MDASSPDSPSLHCTICHRTTTQWFLRITVEDAAGLRQEAFICGNCAIKLRLSSERNRDLQIDPWIHQAVSVILRGVGPGEIDEPKEQEK
ncbi:MAG TPA: hypothetical protein VMU16_08670 [Candidatus Binataceae bacterium]|nr:hypothetical protein [Candidatus Binataceae bacterium]